MMKGSNEFHFCESQMLDIVQNYFDCLFPSEDLKVTGVHIKEDMHVKTFIIKTTSEEHE